MLEQVGDIEDRRRVVIESAQRILAPGNVFDAVRKRPIPIKMLMATCFSEEEDDISQWRAYGTTADTRFVLTRQPLTRWSTRQGICHVA